ncbi:pyruvate formate lyase-activating protein [Clostridium senegalense]|uniref:pyruvate formate-lyase-activating protein n=1 Tax=Clostridium senegalense TaxID=1465809 RepID=UPI001C11FA50|nr:pyruvate formate-lyase-activating protein [Clostridium senegalense]MBU5226120.1 pyruvate formate lyase-activating protein [Clostridium senegalense]
MIKGKIHSIESMGLVDGPGIRVVVFMQGCKLRCAYCHNPDTWTLNSGEEMTADDLVAKVERFKPFFQRSGGGITFSGGDPLVQPEFLLEALKKCKAKGIHTTIDTAGYGDGNYEEILKYTDLVLLDLKHENSDGYLTLTGSNTEGVNLFIKALKNSDCRVWIRHVVVPGYTDSIEHMDKLAKIINEEIPNVDRIDLLPYHLLGVNKYEVLGIKYKLEGVPPMDKERNTELQNYLISKVNFDKK